MWQKKSHKILGKQNILKLHSAERFRDREKVLAWFMMRYTCILRTTCEFMASEIIYNFFLHSYQRSITMVTISGLESHQILQQQNHSQMSLK